MNFPRSVKYFEVPEGIPRTDALLFLAAAQPGIFKTALWEKNKANPSSATVSSAIEKAEILGEGSVSYRYQSVSVYLYHLECIKKPLCGAGIQSMYFLEINRNEKTK